MTFERVKELAQALGWRLIHPYIGSFPYRLEFNKTLGHNYSSLDDVRKRLAEEYRRRAEMAQGATDVFVKLTNRKHWDDPVAVELNAIAEELDAPEQPTMVERIADYEKRNPDHSEFRAIVLDALLDLYAQQGKE